MARENIYDFNRATKKVGENGLRFFDKRLTNGKENNLENNRIMILINSLNTFVFFFFFLICFHLEHNNIVEISLLFLFYPLF